MARKTKLTEAAALKAALAHVARDGWRAASLAAIARDLDRPLGELYGVLPSKAAILTGLSRRADGAMLAAVGPFDAEDSVRDRLFEILMARIDALEPDREAMRVILREVPGDPTVAVALTCALDRTMEWALDAAGAAAGGLAGLIRRKGLAAVWLATLRAWDKDDTPDRARTMAALDKALRRAERAASMLPASGARGGTETDGAPGAEPA